MSKTQNLRSLVDQYSKESSSAPLDIERVIKKAYEGNVNRLITEGNDLRKDAYTGFFDTAEKLGTDAGDMSPSARLSAMISEGERGKSRYNTNLGLRDYYGTMANDMVGKGLNAYQLKHQGLADQYNRAFQTDQFDWQKQQQKLAQDLQRQQFEWEKRNSQANRALQERLSAQSRAQSTQQNSGLLGSLNDILKAWNNPTTTTNTNPIYTQKGISQNPQNQNFVGPRPEMVGPQLPINYQQQLNPYRR